MSEPIVFISRFRVVVGKRPAVQSMFAGAVDLMAATKPRTALFAAYLDARGSEVRIVHAFSDPEAIADHFEGSAERSRSVDELMVPAGFEVFGRAPASVVGQLAREAHDAGVGLDLFGEPLGGFMRDPD